MSLSIFNAVPAGAIEVLLDEENQPWFKRAHVGKFLELYDIESSLRHLDECEERARSSFNPLPCSTRCWTGPKNQQNRTDKFLSAYGVMHVVVNSRKSKGKELKDWILRDVIPRGVNKLMEEEHQKAIDEKQKAIEEKDMQLALLNDDLTESENLVRELEFNNTGLQGEIRAKDQEIARRQSEITELRQRYVDHCRDPRKDNTVMITRKHTSDEDDEHFEYPYYISRIQRCKIPTKRRWLLTQFPDSEEIVVIDNPNSVHAFNRLEEEGHVERYGCHFKLIDLTREDLYDMGVPAIDA